MCYIFFSLLHCQHKMVVAYVFNNKCLYVCLLYLALFFNESYYSHTSSMAERTWDIHEKFLRHNLVTSFRSCLQLNAPSVFGRMKNIFRENYK